MKNSILILFVMAAVLFAAESYAQGLKFGVGGGLSMVQTPDAYANDIADGGAGFSSEYHFGIKAKLSLPLVPVTPVAFLNYHLLSGEGESAIGNVESKQNILTVGVGVNYNLIPGPLSPYAALDLQYNSFGDYEIGSQTFAGNSRVGLGVGAGVDFTLLPMLDFDVSAKYNMLNLFGKEGEEETIGIITLNLTVMFGGL
jgi:hypothetical protein